MTDRNPLSAQIDRMIYERELLKPVLDDSREMRAAIKALMAALEALLRCPEIADCDPRDKDPETEIAERNARAAIKKARGE